MQYMQGLIRLRLEPELAKLESADVSTIMQEIGSNKPSALPHTKGAVPEERRVMALERVELRDKQRAAKRKAVLSQLSPVQQIQILEDTVTAQLKGLLSIDFMELFERSYAMLLAVCVAHPGWLKKVMGISSHSPVSTLPDRLAQVPLLVGERLTGDAAKDEETLRILVRDVRTVISSEADTRHPLYKEDIP